MAGEGIEVTIEGLHIDFHVRHGLGAIDQHWDIFPVGHFDHLRKRVDCPKGIGDVRYGGDSGFRS